MFLSSILAREGMLRGERENGRNSLRKRKSLFNIIKPDEAPPTDKPNIVETMQVILKGQFNLKRPTISVMHVHCNSCRFTI